MKFFSEPKKVTAIVFFIQTVLALLNMKYLVYVNIFEIMFLCCLFVLFPFIFFAIYRFIITELDDNVKVTEQVKSKVTPPKPTNEKDENHSFIPFKKVDNVEENIKETEFDEVPEQNSQRKQSNVMIRDEVFEEEDTLLGEEIEQTEIIKPMVNKKAKAHRLERKKELFKSE